MNIASDNLEAAVRASCDYDLQEVLRTSQLAGAAIPDVRVHLAALDREGVPTNLPDHSVPIPLPKKPNAFGEQCAWRRDRQSFQFVEDGGDVWVIGGSDAGCLFGFGELLECLAGVIWDGLNDGDVLFGAKRSLPMAVRKPRFAFRCRDGSPPKGSPRAFLRWLSRNRYNMMVFTGSQWAEMPAPEREDLIAFMDSRCMLRVVGYHDMGYWLPDGELEAHTEWQGMRERRRVRRGHVEMPEVPGLNAELPIQPCYSNGAVAEVITDRMAAMIADHPEIDVFSIWPHDGVNNWCQCPDCLRKTPYEHMYDLAIRLIPKIRADLPIELIAYSNLLNLPFRELAHSDRIVCMICPYLRSFKHRIYEDGGPELTTGARYPEPDRINPLDDREYGELFRRWSAVWEQCGGAGGIFEYGSTFPDETRRVDYPRYLYFPEPELREDEAAWYAERGIAYFYMCSTYKGWPDNFLQLHFAKTMWKRAEDTADFERRYYEAIAGAKGMALRNALKAVAQTIFEETDFRPSLRQFDKILDQLPESPQTHRCRLWAQYVALARPAREYELAGDYEKAIAQERKVREFLEANSHALEWCVDVRLLLQRSRTFAERFDQKLRGGRATEYTL